MTDLKLGQSRERERERESKSAAAKKTIKVNACDLWYRADVENSGFLELFGKCGECSAEISDSPDFLVYSCFGAEFKKYHNCVKIFITGENIIPNFNECDYAIGFDDIKFGDRYLRYNTLIGRNVAFINERNIADELINRRFCNFMYSNFNSGEGTLLRQEFFHKLSEYKHIDAPGKVCHNTNYTVADKLEYIKNYKFTIAFENSKSLGYTTEKLFDPLKMYSIPIYWGNPDIVKDINPKSFINCNDYDDFGGVIKRVIELDNDDEQYLAMLREKPILENSYLLKQEEEYEKFFINIIKKGNKPYNKDPRNFQSRKEPKPKKTALFKIKREFLRLFGIKIKP